MAMYGKDFMSLEIPPSYSNFPIIEVTYFFCLITPFSLMYMRRKSQMTVVTPSRARPVTKNQIVTSQDRFQGLFYRAATLLPT